MSVVWLSGIGKRYKEKIALSHVDLVLEAGEVLGVVGPNGVGKSTLLGIIAGLVLPTEGEGGVLGEPIGPRQRPCPFVGVMVERPAFLENLSGRENLRVLASLRGRIGVRDIEKALEKVGLDPKDKRPVRTYSQGMRQRLSLAQAIMEHPLLYLLDEPTNGLDPQGIVEMRSFIRSMADEGAAVILSSHLLSEVEAVCDRVMIFSAGRCVREFMPGTHEQEDVLILSVSVPDQLVAVATISGVTVLDQIDERSVRLRCEVPVPELVRRLVSCGVDVEHVSRAASSLEEIYLQETTVQQAFAPTRRPNG